MEKSWVTVISLLEAHPKLGKVWTKCPGFFDGHKESKMLPLHQICASNPPIEALEAVVNAYPKALNMKESGYGRLPIHIACHSGANYAMLAVLLRDFPESVIEQDVVGRVPLHYACSNGAQLKVIREIVICDPQCVKKQDVNGWLPLHVACRVGSETSVINYLLEINPASATQATSKNNVPLGLVCMEDRKNRDEVIALIKFYAKLSLSKRPETMGIRDHGRPPRYVRQRDIEAKDLARTPSRNEYKDPDIDLDNSDDDASDHYDSSCGGIVV